MADQEKTPQNGTVEPETQSPLLHGPRQLGAYETPSGAVVSREETSDGMSQTMVYGSSHKSAAEFHVEQGVGTPAEIQRVTEMQDEARARAEALEHARVIDPQQ